MRSLGRSWLGRRESGEAAGATVLAPAGVEPCCPYCCGCDERRGYQCVGDAAMMLEAFDGAGESPDDVEVGGFCGEYSGHCCVSSFAVETGAADACAGKEVRDGLHVAGNNGSGVGRASRG